MRSKKSILGNFTRAMYSESFCIRPNTEKELLDYLKSERPKAILARGAGLSYSDSCFNTDHLVIDTQFLNHFIHFDEHTGVVVCQGGMPLLDLFLLHQDFIPPVVPGTIHATVAGCIAHDVHGKNNHREASFGRHVLWLEIIVANKLIRCSPYEHSDLFYATVGGLGLTGIITQVALQMKHASRSVSIENKTFESIQELTQNMSSYGLNHDYQVAWLDLLNPVPRSIHCMANHSSEVVKEDSKHYRAIRFPFRMIYKWNMLLFNKLYFVSKKQNEQQGFIHFNNPLDSVDGWNRLYGPKGLIQFQALFDQNRATEIIEQLIHIIREHKAIPTLAVLKLFIQSGNGLLSFCQPGFTIAIDFVHNQQAKQAIMHMNQFITDINGRVYLAKDLLLNPDQFRSMYNTHEQFEQTLKHYRCNMHSDLAERVGINHDR
ncbi:FAD-binding oxidoreductase [Legionella waltersii]|uniref:L-gululonolactone oxidase n=1 Tax=Legionella waltersii TaxID=66969 RepID=A0A0W1AAI8_9GAMM|nr:FAD-binding oxidoreductase [Legionella waltersii]KTD78373.1 L-gululonolactone oxidase [Legionella waltersii]SNV06393.1 oxidoreductase (L-gululonolactone oxidase) [Legionella waltersii]